MKKAVIFDMDGVIADSEPVHIKTDIQVMKNNGVKLSSHDLAGYTGSTAKHMLNDLIKKYKIPKTFEELFDERNEILFSFLEEELNPTKGVIELINNLKGNEIKLAVASSSHKKLIMFVLNKLNIKEKFNAIVGADDITNSKPDPEIFLKAASKLSVKNTDCVVIEDAKHGVEAAKKANMKCIGYKPESNNQDLSGADIIIDDFSKLNVQKLLQIR
jgi:beta-phosphoglucomutase family hydrolase